MSLVFLFSEFSLIPASKKILLADLFVCCTTSMVLLTCISLFSDVFYVLNGDFIADKEQHLMKLVWFQPLVCLHLGLASCFLFWLP